MFQKLLASKHYRLRDSKSRPRLGRAKDLVWSPTKLNKKPRCGWNRALKLTVTHTVRLRFCYFFYLYANAGSARETWHGYRRHLLLHNDRISLRWRNVTRCLSLLRVFPASSGKFFSGNTSLHSLRWAQEFTWIGLSHKAGIFAYVQLN